MPLQENDIVVDRIRAVQILNAQGRPVRGMEYRFTVRGQGPFTLEFPEEKCDFNFVQQAIIRYAADQADILDTFASRG